MICELVTKRGYGDVLSEPITIKHSQTYHSIVKRLAAVSFEDSSFDSKGAAFEYYVRATLKGKRLGQYFTPRAVIHLMSVILGRKKIANSAMSIKPLKVLDPACGTGGFLVYLMKQSLDYILYKEKSNEIASATARSCIKILKENVFYGADANQSVASSAKMNMIIAGDGHSNIQCENSLSASASSWSTEEPTCDIIVTNPPFGTSESDTLSSIDNKQFLIPSSKGQLLFLQKMVLCVNPKGGEVCTVIDEGVLNTDGPSSVRNWILQNCFIDVIVRLPDVTFSPNKISVRSSVLYLRRREHPDVDFESSYDVTFLDIKSLGYYGSGESIRGFDEVALMQQIEAYLYGGSERKPIESEHWSAFQVPVEQIIQDKTSRLDLKYWSPTLTKTLAQLSSDGCLTIQNLAIRKLQRGKSPPAENYVDEKDGYAHVIKAGTNINKFGEIIVSGDFIEKNLYEEMMPAHLLDGDLLVSSTGNGTLGKCAIYRGDRPSIADSHVTIVRLDQEKCFPEYVCDYLRFGFGALQIQRLYTGSTNLIELTPEELERVFVELPATLEAQKTASSEWRAIESRYRTSIATAEKEFFGSRSKFLKFSAHGPLIMVNPPEEILAEP